MQTAGHGQSSSPAALRQTVAGVVCTRE